TSAWCPERTRMTRDAAESQSLIVLSLHAAARYLPSGLKATVLALPLPVSRLAVGPPELASHSLILFFLAAATVLPSELKATDFTADIRPSRVRSHLRESLAQRSTVVQLAATTVLPSGLSATLEIGARAPSNLPNCLAVCTSQTITTRS